MNTLKTLSFGIFFSIICLSGISTPIKTSIKTNVSTDVLKKIGKEIINERKITSVNTSIIYQLIDSALSKNPTERKFYFKVFNKINKLAKGEVVVELDWIIKEFCHKYPNDFFSISDTEVTDYARRIGELVRTEEEYPTKTANEYINNILKTTDKKYQKKLNMFTIELMKKIKEK
jgi:hypothetical protein